MSYDREAVLATLDPEVGPVPRFNDTRGESTDRRAAASQYADAPEDADPVTTDAHPRHDPPTVPGSVRAIRKGKLREALFGSPPAEEHLGRYVLRGVLGRGGMGTVVEAYDPTLRRTVALKLLHRDLAESHGRRLLREARALARVSHPNVVHVHEAGTIDDRAFIAMELVRGESLHDWQQRPHTWRETIDLYRQAGRGLAAAHAAGLVHRDFKPTNCMIDTDGRVRVLDFGLVRELHTTGTTMSLQLPPSRGESMQLARTLTRTGAVVGTLIYMAPEQLCGRGVDARSDQYSFCAALFEALFGALPYDGKSIGELISAVMGDHPPTFPRGVKVPAHVRRALVRGLRSDPDQRWPSMDALLSELSRTSASTGWVIAGSVALAVAATAAAWTSAPEQADGGCETVILRWDDERRAAVRSALTGHEQDHGASSWGWGEPASGEVSRRLDRYADGWRRHHDELCDAARAEPQPSSMTARRQCLEHRADALEAALTVLGQADPTTAVRALTVVSALPSVDACTQPSMAVAVRPEASVRRAVALATAWLDAGHIDTAREALDSAATEGHPATPYLWAQIYRAREQPDHTQQALVRAWQNADDPEQSATALRALAQLAALPDAQDPDERWLSEAQTFALRPTLDPELAATLMQGIASRMQQREQTDAAIEWRQQALERWVIAHPDDPMHPAIARAHAELGHSLLDADRADTAIDHYHHARVRMETLLGPAHPALAPTLVALAEAERLRAQPRAARRYAQRALALMNTDAVVKDRAQRVLDRLDGAQAIR